MQAWQDKPDDTLLEHLRQGSHHAFAVLVERYTQRFYRLAYRYVAEKQAAEDIVQHAFLKLWEKPKRFDSGKGVLFTTWFSRVVINLALDAQKRHRPLPLAEGFEMADDTDSQETGMISAQQNHVLEQAIQSLPPRQQTALNLCFYEELPQKEVAQIMEISLGAVESLLMRAKANLRDTLTMAEPGRRSA